MKNKFSDFYYKVNDCCLEDSVRIDYPLSDLTTYKIGGPVKFFICPKSVNDLKLFVKLLKDYQIEFFVIGGGSNVLASDFGFNGACINLSQLSLEFKYENKQYVVGAGVKLAKLVNDCRKKNFSGFEFAVGTPGTAGGALYMNAGTKDDWIGSRVFSLTVLKNNSIIELAQKDIEWSYRHTSIGDDCIIISAKFNIKPITNEKDVEVFHHLLKDKLKARKQSQPLNFCSCGSVFKNPIGKSAGFLIENVGLKGKSYGNAQISEKHANFIINKGNAKAHDVLYLINLAQRKVFESYGIKLIPEVKFLGFDVNPSLY